MVFIYLFLAALGLCCFVQAFSSGEWELLFISVLGLLVAVASLVAERGPWVLGLQLLRLSGSVVVAHGAAMPSSRESCQPRDQTQVSHIAGSFFTI